MRTHIFNFKSINAELMREWHFESATQIDCQKWVWQRHVKKTIIDILLITLIVIKDCFTLFTSYAGAICVQDGVELLEDWVWWLVYPQESDMQPDQSDNSHEVNFLFAPHFNFESTNISGSSSSFQYLILPPPIDNSSGKQHTCRLYRQSRPAGIARKWLSSGNSNTIVFLAVY